MKKPIMIEDLCDYKYCSELSLSPDGKKASFVISQGNMSENNYSHGIYCYDFEKSELKQYTSSNERGVIWENEHQILFPSDRDSSAAKAKSNYLDCTNYYRLDLNGGEATKAFSIPLNVLSLKFVSEDIAVVLALKDTNAVDVSGLEGEALAQAKEKIEDNKDYEVLDELPYWFNGRGFINKKRKQVYLVNLKSNEVELLSPKLMEVDSFVLANDSKEVVFTGNEFDSVNNQYTGIFKVDLASKEFDVLLDQNTMSVGRIEMLDDMLVFTGTDYQTYGTSENSKMYKMDIHTKEMTCFLDQDITYGTTIGSDAKLFGGKTFVSANHKIYFTSVINSHSNIYSIDLDGNFETYTTKSGSVDCFSVKNDRIVFFGMRDLKLQELYELQDTKEVQLTSINHGLDDKEVLPLVNCSFTNKDNILIEGWVIEPRGYEPGKSYPAVFDIHGGPKAAYGEVFFHEMQVWASAGYFVFFCNPRGSDGRGNEFMHLVNKYGTVDYSDLMEFTDTVLAKYPDINKDKVAVTGGSYGGFMTNWIIGHTDRYCCAASQRSISNYVSKSLTTDIGYYHNMSQMASTPWENFDRMWSFSPIAYADKCVTPTLFIHSDEDYRCWMAEGLQMFQALKIHNVDARLCLFKKENHELSRSGKPKHRRRRLNEMTSWFDKYCK